MASIAKTVVATGVSSGLGFEAIKHLVTQSQQAYKVLLGARNTNAAQSAYDDLKFDASKHTVKVLPLELADLKDVRTFARQTLEQVGNEPIDYLLLNAGIGSGGEGEVNRGYKWREILVVNSISQHYLVHLLREKLISSRSRIVFVSSGAIRRVTDPSVMDDRMKAGCEDKSMDIYSESKFAQLLTAHWWRRELAGQCHVVAVSPGLIPGTGLGRGSGLKLTMDMPDAKPVSEGGENVLRAFTRDDFPEDPEQIFLTSWGEWWPKDVYSLSLDKALQDKWSPSKEEIEAEAGIDA